MGSCSSALAQLGNGTEGHLHPTSPPGLDKKRRFFVFSLCVLGHKPYVTLLHIQTLILRVVERSGGNHTRAGGEEASPNHAAHNVVLIIQLPLISLSPFLSHTCTKRLIFGLKRKKKQSNLKHTLQQTSVQCKQSIKLKRSICTRYQLLHFF